MVQIITLSSKIFSFIFKIFFVILVLISVVSLFYAFSQGQRLTISNNTTATLEFRHQLNNTINKLNHGSKEDKKAAKIYSSIFCLTIGETCSKAYSTQEAYQASLIGRMAGLISLPIGNPPASGIYYVYHTANQFGFIPKTQAAYGVGFGALRPFTNLWVVFRDMAYLILVLVLIVVGFMIMFRWKLNPQTIISIENALPKIIVAMIMIALSYAIAGFLIDIMYATILFLIAFLSNRGNFFDASVFQNAYINAGFEKVGDAITPVGSGGYGVSGVFQTTLVVANSLVDILPNMIQQILQMLIGGLVGIYTIRLLHPLVFGWVDDISTIIGAVPLAGPILGGVVEIVLKIIVSIGLFSGGFTIGYNSLRIIMFLLVIFTIFLVLTRIFVMLLKTYIRIFLLVITAPIILMLNAIPGKSTLGYWFKNIVAELSTYPILIAIFIISYIIVNIVPSVGQVWKPPFLGGMNPQALTMLLGIGLVWSSNSIIKEIKKYIGVQEFPIQFGPQTFLAGAGTGITGTASVIGGYGNFAKSIPALANFVGKMPLGSTLNKLAGVGGGGGGGGGGPTPCIVHNTLIKTQKGNVCIQDLKKNMKIWSKNRLGKLCLVKIREVKKYKITKPHVIITAQLSDGRFISATSNHPIMQNKTLSQYCLGEVLDGSIIVSYKYSLYTNYFYDILPLGESGIYYANNIPIVSTLFQHVTYQKQPKIV